MSAREPLAERESDAFTITWRDGAYRVSVPNLLDEGVELQVTPSARLEQAEARLQQAREALKRIAAPGCMHKTYYIDTDEPARIAKEALDALSSGEETT